MADNGYPHTRYITLSNVSEEKKEIHFRLRARDESFNLRIEFYNILDYTFRRDIGRHGFVFHSVGRLITCTIHFNNPLFYIFKINVSSVQTPGRCNHMSIILYLYEYV